MYAKEKLLCSYMDCLNKITGYDDMGNELNFLNDRDELLCKISSISLVGLLVKWDIESKGKYASDMDIITNLAKIVNIDNTSAVSMAYALMCSNEGIEVCKNICMKDSSVQLVVVYSNLKSDKSFKDIVGYVISNVKVD